MSSPAKKQHMEARKPSGALAILPCQLASFVRGTWHAGWPTWIHCCIRARTGPILMVAAMGICKNLSIYNLIIFINHFSPAHKILQLSFGLPPHWSQTKPTCGSHHIVSHGPANPHVRPVTQSQHSCFYMWSFTCALKKASMGLNHLVHGQFYNGTAT